MYYMHSGDGTSIFWHKLCVIHSNFYAKCLCIVLCIFVHNICICRLPELNWLISWLVILALRTFSLPYALRDGSTSLNTFEQHLKESSFQTVRTSPSAVIISCNSAATYKCHNLLTYSVLIDRMHWVALKNADMMACGGTTATRIASVLVTRQSDGNRK